MEIPAISTDQMREVDRLMMEVYGIQLIQMMENAGRNLAFLARQNFLDNDPLGKKVLVLAGTGGNGGGGLVAARRLHTWGAQVHVFTTKKAAAYKDVPGHQIKILQRMALPVIYAGDVTELQEVDLILDSIIGYSLQGPPIGLAAELIRKANNTGSPILSLDVPSGIDSSSGEAFDPHIQASATLTLALGIYFWQILAFRPICLKNLDFTSALYLRIEKY